MFSTKLDPPPAPIATPNASPTVAGKPGEPRRNSKKRPWSTAGAKPVGEGSDGSRYASGFAITCPWLSYRSNVSGGSDGAVCRSSQRSPIASGRKQELPICAKAAAGAARSAATIAHAWTRTPVLGTGTSYAGGKLSLARRNSTGYDVARKESSVLHKLAYCLSDA